GGVGLMVRGFGLGASFLIVGRVLQCVMALAFVVLACAVIYYFAPDVKEQHWYWITPGSVVGLLVWAFASVVLRGYLHYFNTYSKTYGSLGGAMILMLWFYITGLAFLLVGQINSTIEHAAAGKGHHEPMPIGTTAAEGAERLP